MKKTNNRFFRLLRYLYLRLFRINDAPHKIAIGFGIGVFLGIMPGMGPVAALVIATLSRTNRAAALLGVILTNTWLSFLIFVLSVKTGALMMGLQWQTLLQQWRALLHDFHWNSLFQVSVLHTVAPIALGYFVWSALLAIGAYLVCYAALRAYRAQKKRRARRATV